MSVPLTDSTAVGATAEKTLLLVGSIPGNRNVGQILLREMLACVDREQFVVAAMLDSKEAEQADPVVGTRVFERPHEHAKRMISGRMGGMLAAAKRFRDYDPAIAALVNEIRDYAQANQIDRVWAVLNMPSVMDVCAQLMKTLRVPLLAHVWDDVGHLSQQRGLDAFSRWRIERRFGRLLATAEHTAVIGESMAASYTQRYGARCQIVRHGVSDSVVARGLPTSDEEFVIGFSGGMYCPSAWTAFQAALGKLGWKVGGKRVRLIVMSGQVTFSAQSPAQVEFLGWRDDEEVHARLSGCDLLYLPQPFEPAQRELSELSFPTKLSAYVSTGRPILVHAPEYASVSLFSHEHPVGVVCNSLVPERLASVIEGLAIDAKLYAGAASASAKVANTVLSRGSFHAQVRTFLSGAGS
ncbi:hypothetical protein [Thermomonas sp.]|uniref:hypothetical protein n=1 Tax=Thermomonas sp. TaxID=1971895 RepID=UPI0024896BEA|nr:hypothetical protein [Thermomonas sp.]MDI1253514.1 hypothetical protein [Thermomonas sp.]